MRQQPRRRSTSSENTRAAIRERTAAGRDPPHAHAPHHATCTAYGHTTRTHPGRCGRGASEEEIALVLQNRNLVFGKTICIVEPKACNGTFMSDELDLKSMALGNDSTSHSWDSSHS